MANIMLRVNPGDGKPKPKSSIVPNTMLPGFKDMPLFIPKDQSDAIRLLDDRAVNPATGMPFGKGKTGAKTLSVRPNIIKAIVAHAKAKGIDPYDALAIPYQETGFGASGTGVGENKDYFPDEGVGDSFDDLDERNMNLEVNAMVKGLADKFNYAKSLGYANKGKEYQFQAYNGYGKLRPQAGQRETSFYGIPVSRENPLDMAKNPVYGKVVSSLRNILANNPNIKKIVDTTPAFRNVWDPEPEAAPAKKVVLHVRK